VWGKPTRSIVISAGIEHRLEGGAEPQGLHDADEDRGPPAVGHRVDTLILGP